jgi:hypothetical protein
MGPIGNPEMSVQNYHSMLHKIPKNADLIDIAAGLKVHKGMLFILFLTIFKSRPVYVLSVADIR